MKVQRDGPCFMEFAPGRKSLKSAACSETRDSREGPGLPYPGVLRCLIGMKVPALCSEILRRKQRPNFSSSMATLAECSALALIARLGPAGRPWV